MSEGSATAAPDAAADSTIARALARRALAVRHDALPADVRRVARDCLADWLAVTIAAGDEPVVRIVRAAALADGAGGPCTLVPCGTAARLSDAALINGTASHALDYDDVNLVVPGHPTVAVLSGLLALAEQRRASGRALLAAFVAGYETMCRVGALVGPGHYGAGFHATVTLGTFGAAAACAHLLDATPGQAAQALGVAATQAAGLKAMFGTMAKPLHAGMAAQNGLRAALLAVGGFEARDDVFECRQGFAELHAGELRVADALADPPGGYHLLRNLFKFHAACYSVQSTIECMRELRRDGVDPDRIVSAVVKVGEGCTICNIPAPSTSLESKFSLRAAAAFALRDLDTGAMHTFSAENALDARVVSIRDRVRVDLTPGWDLTQTEVSIELDDGRRLRTAYDCGQPIADKAGQSAKVRAKFASLVEPALGAAGSARLLEAVDGVESCPDAGLLLRAFRRDAGPAD